MQYRKKNIHELLKITLLLLVVFMLTSCFSKFSKKDEHNNSGDKIEFPNNERVSFVSDVILGANDEIEVTVYRHDDLTKIIKIPFDGFINYPLVGQLDVRGKGIRQLQQELTEKLSEFVVNPQVSIEATSFKGQKIFVLGEVMAPGVYQIDPPITVLDAISFAGGITSKAKNTKVLLIKGDSKNKKDVIPINLKQILKKGDMSQSVALNTGDVIYVPKTFVTSVDRFFEHMSKWLNPVLTLERIIAISPQIEEVLNFDNAKDGQGPTIIIGD